MASKTKLDGGDRSNRVKFVMLEADITDMNVNVLATAIVSALRSDVSVQKRLTPPAPPAASMRLPSGPATNPDEQVEDERVVEPAADAADAPVNGDRTATPAQPRQRRTTKPTLPKYVELFANTAEADAFKAFVAQHPTKKDSERYLVCALYLRDHGHPVVNLDKVYSCYRIIGGDWQMTINDWDVNLRNQVRNDRLRRVEGGYSITTKGEGIVQKLRQTP